MRKRTGVAVAVTLIFLLLLGCAPSTPSPTPSPSPTSPGNDGRPSIYTGFMTPAEGQWAEYVLSIDGQEAHQKMEYIGKDTVDGKNCIGFEMTMSTPGEQQTVLQIWTDASTRQAVKYVMKMGEQVVCMGIAPGDYQAPHTETPDEYDPNLPHISYGRYTTPTGKTIDVAKFTQDQVETWVSSQVPFGMVKVIDRGGKTAMYLYDFGTAGAHRDISKSEMESCMQLVR